MSAVEFNPSLEIRRPARAEKILCDIVIPIWNQEKRTRRCLASILRNTAGPFRLILIDNASDPPTADFLKEFAKAAPCPVTLIRNEKNLGNIKAVNQGLRASNADFVCLLDNDTVPHRGWLEKMIRAAESREDIGIVNPGPCGLGYNKPWHLTWGDFASKVAAEEKGRAPEISMASGECMLIKRRLIEQIGGWNEDYGMGYYEDSDYSRRAAQAGFVCARARDALVWHEGSASFRKIKKVKETISDPNRRRFENEFGRPKRIAFFLARVREEEREPIAEKTFQLAKANNWIWIFLASGAPPFHLKDHAYLKPVRLPQIFFPLFAVVQVLKKKKKFDEIYFNDERLYRIFAALMFLHNARLNLMGNEPSSLPFHHKENPE